MLYTFCRYVDDVADDSPDPHQARRDLLALDAELAGTARPRPLVRSLLDIFAAREVDPVHARSLVHGVSTDLHEVRVGTDDELLRYGYHVAGTVGLMMCGLLGVRDRHAWAFAVDLGVAMQITNICRDVAEDARRGRVYLPAQRLEAHGVRPDPSSVLAAPAPVARVVSDLLDLADVYYRSAERGMVYLPARTRLAIHVAARVYRGIGVRLRAHGCDALAGRTVVPRWQKIGFALGGVWSALRRLFHRTPTHEARLHDALAGLPGCAVGRAAACSLPVLGEPARSNANPGGAP